MCNAHAVICQALSKVGRTAMSPIHPWAVRAPTCSFDSWKASKSAPVWSLLGGKENLSQREVTFSSPQPQARAVRALREVV